jgi:hypothetical protein
MGVTGDDLDICVDARRVAVRRPGFAKQKACHIENRLPVSFRMNRSTYYITHLARKRTALPDVFQDGASQQARRGW